MWIEVIQYDGSKKSCNPVQFEFRTNQVSNWIKVKFEDGTEDIIRNVCVIRTINKA